MNIGSYSSVVNLQPLPVANLGRESVNSSSPLTAVDGIAEAGNQSTFSNSNLTQRPVVALDPATQSQAGSSSTQNTNSNGDVGAAEDTAVSERSRAEESQEKARLQQEQQEIQQLSARDQEVRAHEQAHAAVGGQYAGAPRYEYQRGPDGVRYAVGGEVSIDVSRAATAAETIQKMQTVRRAALAPAEPSPQDRRVASQASATEAEARQELAIETQEQAERPESSESENEATSAVSSSSETSEAGQDSSAQADIGFDSGSTLSPIAFNSISSQLQRSILASNESRVPGSIVNQLA